MQNHCRKPEQKTRISSSFPMCLLHIYYMCRIDQFSVPSMSQNAKRKWYSSLQSIFLNITVLCLFGEHSEAFLTLFALGYGKIIGKRVNISSLLYNVRKQNLC